MGREPLLPFTDSVVLKMFFLVSIGLTQAHPPFQVITDTFWNLPSLPGHGVRLGKRKRKRSGLPPRAGSVLPFLRKDLVTVSALSSTLIPNKGSKPLPRAQARVLKTRSLVKDAEKNLGSRATGTSRAHGPKRKRLWRNMEMVLLLFSLQGTVPPPLGRCSKFPAIPTDYYSTDVEAEAPILWPVDTKSFLTGKDPDAGKD